MLTRRKLEDDVASHKRYLVECVTSATAIIAIFDLFCRTFTMNYCVLSLAYSVYIASSIFLLQVQAAPDDGQALERLNYCIESLKQVRTFSPGKSHALGIPFPSSASSISQCLSQTCSDVSQSSAAP